MLQNVIALIISNKIEPIRFKSIACLVLKYLKQGIDGSACKPALVQDTNYMAEKTWLNF